MSSHPAFGNPSTASFGANYFQTWIIEPQVHYHRSVARGQLDILIGSTFQQNFNTSTSITGTGYSNDALLGSISAAGTKTVNGDSYTLYKYNAIFGRINYNWDRKYILDLTARRDGSSRFGPNHQFGNFGAIGAGWLFAEEPLFKKLKWLSYGKLRASYGTTGNDGIGDYQYQANWKVAQASYQGQSGYVPANVAKPDLSWTINRKLEAFLELGSWNDRILGSVTTYKNRTGNQLVQYVLPTQTGFSKRAIHSLVLVHR